MVVICDDTADTPPASWQPPGTITGRGRAAPTKPCWLVWLVPIRIIRVVLLGSVAGREARERSGASDHGAVGAVKSFSDLGSGAVGPELVPPPGGGRTFGATWRVRLGDVSPGGRLRLDALARYLQDVSSDDTADAGEGDEATWVVRRTVVAVRRAPGYREVLHLRTWCSGIGKRWAERRISVHGDDGGSVEASTLWVHLDGGGRPAPLPPTFAAVYGEAAGGRTVRSSLHHGPPPPGAATRPWPLRAVDLDVLRHVNNAAYWAVVEEELARRRDLRPPFVAEMEHRAALEGGDDARLAVVDGHDGGLALWLLAGGRVAASAVVRPAAGDGAGGRPAQATA